MERMNKPSVGNQQVIAKEGRTVCRCVMHYFRKKMERSKVIDNGRVKEENALSQWRKGRRNSRCMRE